MTSELYITRDGKSPPSGMFQNHCAPPVRCTLLGGFLPSPAPLTSALPASPQGLHCLTQLGNPVCQAPSMPLSVPVAQGRAVPSHGPAPLLEYLQRDHFIPLGTNAFHPLCFTPQTPARSPLAPLASSLGNSLWPIL